MENVAVDFSLGYFVPPIGRRLGGGMQSVRSLFDQTIPSQTRPHVLRRSAVEERIYRDALSQSLTSAQLEKALSRRINSLVEKYLISDSTKEKTAQFISKYPFLIDLLNELPHRIRDFFGQKQDLRLSLMTHEDLPDSAELSVRILTSLSANEAMEILDDFDNSWWFEHIDRSKNKINISLEFV